ncbi:protein tyrosine phosphatase [Rhodoblastus acidophilus]|uniref:Protein tyrosine phosphatase n=1 Tax=Candidatus Rhodoblastus alkanivorans TaxID=2954117 RepID=A0ABS9Z5B7_9HYPH|nr:protein tyrosine phosphatase [Candidatus Rhodoblastus alkanivorans]MCI4677473.1 protein tyrosine phosphatase [Candidatus Rhodoblastus alkanivorans]MCI4681832.1 protein tyrosine phosphatase [Candidatus Rhodoblastus alkanivorans]MDI4642882.1 protein tyrosine phosphatase [Rhodoblastus acidophilus]
MGLLYVCPLRKVGELAAATGAGAVVSLLGPPATAPRVTGVAPQNHLMLGVSDIVAAEEGHVLAGAQHIEALLAFVRGWERARPLVIHCYAGVSRSPAAAFIAACALTKASESEIANHLRRLSPTATPNRHLVALADAILSREGRMVAAIESIGRGADCFEGEIFCMDLT